MRERIISLANEILSSYESLREKARFARSSNPNLTSRVKKMPLSLTVCAVDGGLLALRMHGADIVIARAVGVAFIYEDSAFKSFSYHPGKSPEPDIQIMSSLDEHEALIFRSLVRLKHELGCALESLLKFSPGLLLMDGSLLPLPSDRPSESSELRPLYDEVIRLYRKLYDSCEMKDCILVGLIKDSRSKKLARELGASCSDTLLCDYLLEEGERSVEMPYFEEKAPNEDVAALAGRIRVFYLKPSRNDIPLRVEVMGPHIEDAASLVISLSAISENFAYPAVLIEADMCAVLDSNELESIESSLLSLSGMRSLRRNSRPFR